MSVNVGEVVGSYRIVSPLGEGGLGVVYLAAHKLIGREAAVKVLRPEFCDQDMVSRFFDDAKMTTSIKHPGIVDIYDFGYSETGRPYIVMERLQGDTLTQRLHHAGPLSPQVALAIVRQIASTLGAAHDRGVIHRGLKPDNVFLIRDMNATGVDRVKVLDFGVAKLQATDAHLFKTATGMVLGEPSYMAPEQCIGSPSIDGRADLYALGCILFHMICGRPPFVGAGIAQVLAAHVNMAPPPPTSIVPDTPPEVERMILNLLDKSPQRRPQRASELVIEIDAILPRLPATRAPMGGPPAMPPPSKPMAKTMFAAGAVPAPAPAPSVQGPPPIPRRAPPTEPPPSPYSNGNGHGYAGSNGNGAGRPAYAPNEMGAYGYPVPSQQPSAPIPTHGPPPPAPPLETVEGGVYDGGLRPRNSTSAEGSRRGRLGLIIVLLALAAGGVSAYFIATSVDVSSTPKSSSKGKKTTTKTAAAKKTEPAKTADKSGGEKVAAKTAESEKPAEPAKTAADGVDTPGPTPPAAGSIDPGAAVPPPPTTSPPPAEKPGSVVMVFVTIETEPTGAQVFVDDKQVGTTPYRGEVASGAGNGSYVLKLAGFKDATVLVPRDRSFAETVKLEKGTGTGTIAAVADPPKADPPKADPPKADPPKADPPKADPPRPPAAEVRTKSQSKSSKPRRRHDRPAREEDELFDDSDGGGESRPTKAGNGKRRPKRDLLDL